jgi:hypothetical protein
MDRPGRRFKIQRSPSELYERLKVYQGVAAIGLKAEPCPWCGGTTVRVATPAEELVVEWIHLSGQQALYERHRCRGPVFPGFVDDSS